MADPILSSNIPTGGDLTPAVIRRVVTHQAERHWMFRRFVGTGEFSQIYRQDTMAAGTDVVRVLFSPNREQAGFATGDTIEGKEASVDLFTDSMTINGWSFAYGLTDVMNQQRAPVSLKKMTMTKAPIQWQKHWERNFVYQLTGFTPVNTDAGVTNVKSLLKLAPDATAKSYNLGGMNLVTAVDENHRFYTTGTTAALVGASDEATAGMKIGWIDDLLEIATSAIHLDYPILPGPDGMYDMVIHPVGATQMKKDTTDRAWYDITRARLEGGESWKSNPLYKNFLGEYGQTRIWVSDYLPPAPDAAGTSYEAGTRTFLFLGAKSASISYGAGFGDGNHLDYKEQIRDYDVWGTRVLSIYGVKRTIFPNLSGTLESYGCLLGIHYDENVT